MKSRKELFSVENEIAIHPEKPHETSPAEEPLTSAAAGTDGESSDYYTSVVFEQGVVGKPVNGNVEGLIAEKSHYSWFAILAIMFLCGVAGGFCAVPSVFLQGGGSYFAILLLVVFGPFVEESCKQIGMIFQLEKLPSTVRHGWQIFTVAAISGAVFSVIENLLYRYVYLSKLPAERLSDVMDFRWKYCTLLHVGCTLISAVGLRRVWQDSRRDGVPCRIEKAFGWFVAAMVVHGLYNFTTFFMERHLFPK